MTATEDFGASMPDTVADQLAAILLDGADTAAMSPCSMCGQTAHLLVGGRCAGCWKTANDDTAPPVKRVGPGEREVA